MSGNTSCENCGSDKELITPFMVHYKDNLYRPFVSCLSCVNKAIKAVASNTYPSTGIKAKDVTALLKSDNALKEAVKDYLFQSKAENKKSSIIVKKSAAKKKIPESEMVKMFYKDLGERIIGQEDAKRKVSMAIQRKFMRMTNSNIGKMNVLMVGPSGTGKTEIVSVVSDLVSLPMVKVDCSHLTPSGFKGSNVDTILLRLLADSNNDIELAESGIVFLDEIDKACINAEFGVRIQQELLKLVEGGTFTIEFNKNQPPILFNTKNLTIIAAGSFVGINKILNPKAKIGVNRKDGQEARSEVTFDDLITYGMIPELAGRFTGLATLHPLTKEQILEVLCDKKGNLRSEYEEIFREVGIDLKFNNHFLNMVAEKALASPVGTRKLREIMEGFLESYIFEARTPYEWVEESSIISEAA